MSDGTRMSLSFARTLANQMVDLLRPCCERIEIAGSIRRQKPDVGDRRFIRKFQNADTGTRLTERQGWFITFLWYRYRRQLGVNPQKPEGYQ